MNPKDRLDMKVKIMDIIRNNTHAIPGDIVAKGEDAIEHYKEQCIDEFLLKYEAKQKQSFADTQITNEKLDIPAFLRERKRKRKR
ncbi:hypothetical protein AM500_05520 [Bacillus sp. FJAT-18017]|uniref:hypothetical protein n=1 Tax=Bacillus sp. FJAT-18017 TaxID=1705566 RepID=UPI0006AFE4EA|nr:hypothetical protein [Bacillus sp. FJAT-18017]ALC89304.1 hypothetical protein AM500_05520 [Bacillus sp. FJAT-18017]